MVIQGLDAAVLSAEMHNPEKKLEGYFWPFKRVYWEDASQEMRDDEKLTWFSTPDNLLYGRRKYTLVRPTEKEKEIIIKNKREALRDRFIYLLTGYGYDAAEFYYTKARAKEFSKVKYEIDLNKIPRCMNNKQCDLRCGYYNPAGCTFKGDFNADNL